MLFMNNYVYIFWFVWKYVVEWRGVNYSWCIGGVFSVDKCGLFVCKEWV